MEYKNVKDISGMFKECPLALNYPDIYKWNISTENEIDNIFDESSENSKTTLSNINKEKDINSFSVSNRETGKNNYGLKEYIYYEDFFSKNYQVNYRLYDNFYEN